ncbi:MAG: hypothetical protein ACRCUY_06220 [Thermoguttaceae bacterium]
MKFAHQVCLPEHLIILLDIKNLATSISQDIEKHEDWKQFYDFVEIDKNRSRKLAFQGRSPNKPANLRWWLARRARQTWTRILPRILHCKKSKP